MGVFKMGCRGGFLRVVGRPGSTAQLSSKEECVKHEEHDTHFVHTQKKEPGGGRTIANGRSRCRAIAFLTLSRRE
jgi:hypothetical protein